MATRALIARGNLNGWEARYHHWDGYPSGLGATLYKLFNGYFEKDAKAMLKVLIDDHPAGWSTINAADWNLEPGFLEYDSRKDLEEPYRPQCYCHGDRKEEGGPTIKDTDGDFWGAEYCYVINEETNIMRILGRKYDDGSPAVQFFGVDASVVADGVHWKTLAFVNLDGEEPQWGDIY